MARRISALRGHYTPGKIGLSGRSGVALREIRDLGLHQIAAWPDTLSQVGRLSADAIGSESAPGPCDSASSAGGSLLRIEPLKWWLLGDTVPSLPAEQGATLDLSHSRTCIRISGVQAVALLNRLMSLDLREQAFAVGAVASTAVHHVGVTLWRNESGYDLFIPRGFALSIWEVLLETAAQFGAEID